MTFEELVTKLTATQITSTMLSLLTTLGFPTASWAKGAVIRTIVALVAWTLSPFTELQVYVAKSGFLSLAEGPWLTFLAQETYNVRRELATFATGQVTLTNAGSGSHGPFAIGSFRVYNATTKKVYRNVAIFSISASSTITIDIEAVEIGAASTSAATTIGEIETTLLGVSCSNAAAVTGSDEESDAALRVRCLGKLASLSPNGPALIYEFVVTSFDINGGVACDRAQVDADSTTGDVTVYAAGPSGTISGPDLAKLQTAVDRLATPKCIDATVVSATPITINLVATVWIDAARNWASQAVEDAIEAQHTTYVNSVKLGGNKVPGFTGIHYDALEGEMRKAAPITTVNMTTPATDTAMTIGQVARPGSVAITVVQVEA